ncbi:MAG: FapA family protein [Spirochaetota bacterium]|jgi:uncharacterized protein (DUF342 family)|nr:FapA family protein [Spirochaetota bacterium]
MDRLKEMLAEDLKKEVSRSGPTSLTNMPNDVYGTPDGRVIISAKSIKRALERASDILEENIMNLDYEIIQQGSSGFFGVGAKPCRIIVGVASSSFEQFEADMGKFGGGEDSFGAFSAKVEEPPDRDGDFKVTVRKSGIFICAVPPKGNGRKADINQAISALSIKSILSFDHDIVQRTLDDASGEPVKIGEWQPNKVLDSKVVIDVSADEMKAFAIVTRPEKYGRVLEVDDILAALDARGAKFGVIEDKIREMLDNEVYNNPVVVAQGKEVEPGIDASIKYNFRTDTEKVEIQELEGGKLDYYNLDKVQNVTPKQVLAVKKEATAGSEGRTVTNRRIETTAGKDCPFEAGRNCHVEPTREGPAVISDISGQVYLVNGKVVVDPVFEVAGNADLSVGNITFLGTVIVKGSVEENIEIKAAGNVEVYGTVNKAKIESDGSVIVRQGIIGKDEGVINAYKDISAKFVERCKLNAGNDVIISESIIDSQVDAGRRVICLAGKRGTISGGRVRAREEVNVKNLGNESSPTTIVEVGTDPKVRERFDALSEEKRQTFERVGEASKNIITLQNQKGSIGLSSEKEKMLGELLLTKSEGDARLAEITEELEELRKIMSELEAMGRVGVQKTAYPGARIIIKNATLEVRDNFKACTFMQEAGIVRVSGYEPPKEEKAKASSKDRR